MILEVNYWVNIVIDWILQYSLGTGIGENQLCFQMVQRWVNWPHHPPLTKRGEYDYTPDDMDNQKVVLPRNEKSVGLDMI